MHFSTTPTHKARRALARLCLVFLAAPCIALAADTPSAAPRSTVQLQIQQSIQLPWGKPGFRIMVSGWQPQGAFSVHAVGPHGEKVELVPLDKPLHADADGAMVIDIDYAREGLYPGTWVLLVAGKPGIHLIQTRLPRVGPAAP